MTFWTKVFFNVALASLVLSVGCQKSPVPPGGSGFSSPKQILQHFQIQDLEKGLPHWRLEAVRAELHEDSRLADLEHPLVMFYEGGALSSRLTAPYGKVHIETHAMEAWGGVTVVTSDSATLTTSDLRYDPERKRFLSEAAVRLVRPGSVTEGKGLEATPDLNVVKIGQQRARYTREALRK